jgi:hypothetical protein
MPRGGARAGAGRPVGATTMRTREIADKAAASGMLPHEFLLAVVRGEAIDGAVPTFADRLEAAKAAAPYFAPKLSSVDVRAEHRTSVTEFTDAELYAMLAEMPEGQAVLAARDVQKDSPADVPDWVHLASKLKQ